MTSPSVGDADNPELPGGSTATAFALCSTEEIERFLDGLVREEG
jgi:hypothetical protein